MAIRASWQARRVGRQRTPTAAGPFPTITGVDGSEGPRILFAPRALPPLRPDAAHDPDAYRAALARRPVAAPQRPAPVDVVVVMALPGAVDLSRLRRALSSLGAQRHRRWSLSVAAAAGAADRAAADLEGLGVPSTWTELPGRPGEAALLDAAVRAAPGPWDAVAPLGPDDAFHPEALARLAEALAGGGDAPMAYADEDRLDDGGGRSAPALKPAWSPDLLLAAPYLGRALLVERRALAGAGGFDPPAAGVGAAGWHDLLLRLTDGTAGVPHVPAVLLHRGGPPPAGADAGVWTLTGEEPAGNPAAAALARRGEDATAAPGPLPGTWRVRRPAGPVTASVIVPFRDGAPLLRACVDSVTATAGAGLEVVLVDNGSREPETVSLVERLAGRPGVTVIADPRPFNWAALNNTAAAAARGDLLVFLNNDTEALAPGWLEALAGQAARPDVGAVGARLLYPDGRVQHAGVVVGMGGAAGHVLAGLDGDQPGYGAMAVLTREVSAVTGACLATRRDVFERLGGFDESLGLDLNDVDYCLRARAAGLRVLYEPAAELVHHESPSRGTSGSVPDIERFIARWEGAVEQGDPHLNPQLTRVDSSCALAGDDEEGWWRRWRSTLTTP